jgi:hypothetical protein
MCTYGMKDPESGKLNYKPTCLLHNFPQGILDPIFTRCKNRTTPGHHEHQHLQGWAKGFGARANLAQVYPLKLCNRLASLLHSFIKGRSSVHPREHYFVEDLLDLASFEQREMQALFNYAYSHESGSFSGLSFLVTALNSLPVSVKPVPVYDASIKGMMVTINSMPRNSELYLRVTDTRMSRYLLPLTKKLREIDLPNQRFGKCSVLRGNLGTHTPVPLAGDGENAYVVMWRKNDTVKQVYMYIYIYMCHMFF